jgi:hypothetical protein
MTITRLCLLTLCAALVPIDAMICTAPAAAQTCGGDCNGDRSVAIAEIVLGVRIAFADAPIDDCRALDADDNGAVSVNELVAAVTDALQGCGALVPPTSTSTPVPTNTPVPPPSTPTSVPTTSDEAALAASVRVATEPLLRLFDFQARVGTPGGVAGRSAVSGCQQFDCVTRGEVTGTEEDCCSDTRFSQVFRNCQFDGELGAVVRLNGVFVLDTDNVDLCTGAIPLGGSFTASLNGFTRDVSFPDGSFSRTFQELTESFEVTTGGCTVRQPELLGFGVRGDGRRFIDGRLQQFQSDGLGNVLVDTESDVRLLAIEVSSTGEPDACTVSAALRGSVTSADLQAGTQFSTDLTGVQVVQPPQAGALLLTVDGTVDTDCLGHVTVSTIEPLRIVPGDTCFTAGRLESRGDRTASVTYTESGVNLDLDADGSVDQHFATCTDLPASDKCTTSAVGLCGACTEADQCLTGLSCVPCSGKCTGNTRRCSLGDAFATCEDGVF